MVNYSPYDHFVNQLISLDNFKNHPSYTYMLEHVNSKQGEDYCKLLLEVYSKDTIDSFCKLNDSIGNPARSKLPLLNISVSPTSLRYLYQAHLILQHFKNQPELHIVEIGGGYGGLCLAINFLSTLNKQVIHSYHIIDLDSVGKLQKKYLENFNLTFKVETLSASDYGKSLTRTDYCLISNYCFSEIDKVHQEKYIEHLLWKTKTGFLTWNNIPLYNFGKNVVSEVENPLTGPGNLYVYF
jgi:hypothetical protein